MNPTPTTASATITRVEKGPYTIHSYLSPEAAEMVCSQIIETPSSLVIVDAQLMKEQAQAVRDYAESLGKPITKIIISHYHPDHWAGLEIFSDLPIYALPETVYEINGYGQMMLDSKKPYYGDAVSSTLVLPQALDVDRETIDGLELVYLKTVGTDSTFCVMIELPQLNILISQDAVYNGAYAYFGDRNYLTQQLNFDTWIDVLNGIKAKGYETIFPGHGLPTDTSVCDTMIEYLTFAKAALAESTNGQELKQRIVDKYPDLKVADMLDLTGYSLFPPAQG